MSVKKYDSVNKILKLIAGGTFWADCPLGTINAFGGTTAPEGWLLCQGQTISRTEYADLFAVIGTNFGSGDGSTTFNLPDLRGEFLRGAGTNSHSGQGNGGSVGTHQDGTEHLGLYVYSNTGGSNTNIGVISNHQSSSTSTSTTWEKDADAKHQITGGCNVYISSNVGTFTGEACYTSRPTNTSVNYIMKAKNFSMPADLQEAIESALDAKDMLVWG